MSPDKSLAEILAHRMRVGQPLPVPITLEILRQVCASLDYAHNLRDPEGRPLGIVHRDVQPAYIVVSENGVVRLLGSTAPQGAVAYMAPEFVTYRVLDPRADLFAVGVIAYEMLTNRPLFATNDDRETVARICGLAIPPPSTQNPYVAPEIDGIVLGALAREPSYRWQHAALLRDAIQAAVQQLGLGVTPELHQAWREMLAPQMSPQMSPQMPPPQMPPPQQFAPQMASPQPPPVEIAPAAPPGDPGLWADDPNLETRVQPFNAELLDSLPPPPRRDPEPVDRFGPPPIAPAPVAGPPAARPSVAPAPLEAPRASRPSVAPASVAAARASRPSVAPPSVAPAPVEPARPSTPWVAPDPPPPLSAAARASAPSMPAPSPAAWVPPDPPAPLARQAAPVAPERAPEPPPPPANQFDPDLGPEPTQIGAMPLISFGDEPLVALIGENGQRAPAQRAPAPAAAAPGATFLPDPEEAKRRRIKLFAMVGAAVILVVIVLVVILR